MKIVDAASPARSPPLSVGLFCGSSDDAHPTLLQAAADFGRNLALSNVRLVYGGGGVGLMGAAAKAAHGVGGVVLGVMPNFLQRQEVIYDDVETMVVKTMHERKRVMFEESDAFAVLPGGIGTLEEVVELLSWKRLALHSKPIVFLDQDSFWRPFFTLMEHMAQSKLTPEWVGGMWQAVDAAADLLPAIRKALASRALAAGPQAPPPPIAESI